MKQYGRSRQYWPIHETLHIAHVLMEVSWKFVAGKYRGQKRNELQVVPAFDSDGEEVDFQP
eukprot:10881073-Karenia_brevis.AAC.1